MKRELALIVFLSAIAFLAGCISVDTSPSRCERILDKSFKDDCLLRVAQETNNISKCDEIGKQDVKGRCYYLLSGGAAPTDPSVCRKLTSTIQRDQCFLNAANSKNDFSLCANIESNFSRDGCYSAFASKNKNASLCDGITLENTRENCRNSVFSALAIEQKNPAFCESIKSSLGNTSGALINNCYLNMAKQLNDTIYCNNIDELYTRNFCLTGRIDPNICAQITQENARSMCYFTIAVQSKDPSACSTVDVELRDNCYVQIAHETDDKGICDRISNQLLKDICKQ